MTARQEFEVMINLMDDEDLYYALELVKDNFALRRRIISWDDIPEVEPDEDDLAYFERKRRNPSDYEPYITHDELMKKLGLED
ncbi:MAG: hypothetical protein LBE35_06550 [Clostridiales bacterium]|jgi:hypothetical protein|nr:hypothetical protein [Clostridiales bacterium]